MEYKFRGKTENDEWVYGGIWKNQKGVTFIITEDGLSFIVGRETVGQYTGLKDKNGKEIYTGDNCRIDSGDYSWDSVVDNYGEVDTYDFRNDGEYTMLRWLMKHSFIEVEIIGNIHD